jgi:hypothetical protein
MNGRKVGGNGRGQRRDHAERARRVQGLSFETPR